MTLPPELDQLIQRVTPIAKHFHALEMYAPHAAVIDVRGEFQGHTLTSEGSSQVTVPWTLTHFESKFRDLAIEQKIVASAVFYHGPGVTQSEGRIFLPPAENTADCNAIVALLEHADGTSVYLVIPYEGHGTSIAYASGKLIEKPRTVFFDTKTASRPWWRFWK